MALMSNTPVRWLVALCCFAMLLCGAQTESAWAAKKKPAKSWPSKKKKKGPAKKHAPAAGPAKSGGGAPPAESADDEGEETAQDEGQGDDAEEQAKPAKSAKSEDSKSSRKVARSEDDGDEGGDSSDDEGGDTTVARKKAKFNDDDEDEEGGLVAFELAAGPRVMHRTFDFHDPLSDYQRTLTPPNAYQLPAGPVPFIQGAIYPAAFATRGFAANIGVIGSFEKLVATKTNGQSTLGQAFDAGVRVRVPVGGSEIGFAGAYGQHVFKLVTVDPGPGTGSVPNVAYTFVRLGADGRLRIADLELGAHIGTRLVLSTGALGQKWFPNTKTTVFEAGVSAGYRLTPLVSVLGGVDLLRYAFDFNPVPQMNPVVAGGAVDQYISGWLALRLTIGG
jgi:hypothetical protein